MMAFSPVMHADADALPRIQAGSSHLAGASGASPDAVDPIRVGAAALAIREIISRGSAAMRADDTRGDTVRGDGARGDGARVGRRQAGSRGYGEEERIMPDDGFGRLPGDARSNERIGERMAERGSDSRAGDGRDIRPYPRPAAETDAPGDGELAGALAMAQGALARALRLVEIERQNLAADRAEFQERLREAENGRRDAVRRIEVSELILRRTEERLMQAEKESAARAEELAELQRRLAALDARAAAAELKAHEIEEEAQRLYEETQARAHVQIEAVRAEADQRAESLIAEAAAQVSTRIAAYESELTQGRAVTEAAEARAANAAAEIDRLSAELSALKERLERAEETAREAMTRTQAAEEAERLAQSRAVAAEQAARTAAAAGQQLRQEVDRLKKGFAEELDGLRLENDKLRTWRLKAIDRMQAAGLMRAPANGGR